MEQDDGLLYHIQLRLTRVMNEQTTQPASPPQRRPIHRLTVWMTVLVCLTLKNIFGQERRDSLALFCLETTEQTAQAPVIIANSNTTTNDAATPPRTGEEESILLVDRNISVIRNNIKYLEDIGVPVRGRAN
jgi:hypothetical protein